jgi:hypothetical protein
MPSAALLPLLPKPSTDIIKVDAPLFADSAAARSAAGPSPNTMISHASMNPQPLSRAKRSPAINNAHEDFANYPTLEVVNNTQKVIVIGSIY